MNTYLLTFVVSKTMRYRKMADSRQELAAIAQLPREAVNAMFFRQEVLAAYRIIAYYSRHAPQLISLHLRGVIIISRHPCIVDSLHITCSLVVNRADGMKILNPVYEMCGYRASFRGSLCVCAGDVRHRINLGRRGGPRFIQN